jgi:quercetin dioxygenase-like cupin family protein
MAAEPTVLIYQQIEWDDVLRSARPGTAPPRELVAQAKKTGARRKKLARGEGGFFMNRSVLPAGFRVPPHRHSHDELMIVLSGGCEFDGEVATLGADDSIVIHAGYRYGFTCGPKGMEFLTIRRGEAAMSVE